MAYFLDLAFSGVDWPVVLDDENLEVLGRSPSLRAPAAHGVSTCEALREKTSLLGEFQEIRFNFQFLKIDFLHEKIIFFDQDFFPDKV